MIKQGMLQIQGVSAVIKRLKAANRVTQKQYESRVMRAGRHLQRESMLLVPVDTGNLRGTADTTKLGGKGFETEVIVHYGAGANYAVKVHEDIFVGHKKGKESKYLEKPALTERKKILKILAGG